MAGLAKTLGPLAGPLPMMLAGKNPLDNPLSPIGMIRNAVKDRPKPPTPRPRPEAMQPPGQRQRKADTLLGPIGGFAAPAINRLFR